MKASDIITQLHAELPKHTDLFSLTVGVSTMTFAAGTVTVGTATPHGLASTDTVVVKGALSPVTISTLTQTGGVATAITATDHNLTRGFPDGDDSTVNITGAADAEYNGDKKLLDVLNRKEFTYQVDSGAPASTTGAQLNDIVNFGYNGFQPVSVVDPSTFTYPIAATVNSPASGTIELFVKTQVSGAVNLDKTLLSYTKQTTKMWGFVILDEFPSSKSRQTINDADQVVGPGTDPRQKIIQNFSVYIFVPSKDQIAARAARDQMEDVMIALFRSLLGFAPPSTLSECPEQGITFVNSSLAAYQESVYIHRFQFQNLVDITFDDTLQPEVDAAFRDIHIDFIDPLP